MKIIALALVFIALLQIACSSYVERKLSRAINHEKRVFMQRTRHMSKARLRRFGFCTAALTVLSPILRPLFVPICKKGIDALLGWIQNTVCNYKTIQKWFGSKCGTVVSWLRGQWAKWGSTACSKGWDLLINFLKTLC